MMVKILIYAYTTRVFSWRSIARKLEEDVAFRELAEEKSSQPAPARYVSKHNAMNYWQMLK